MLLDNKQVAIVGGGPAGLALARLLQLKGADVKVYERDIDRNVRVQGATLDLHEGTGLEALKRSGLLDKFYKYHRPVASKMLLVDRMLDIAFDDHNFATITAETRPEIDRAPLRDILLNSLRQDTVVWDSHFISMQRERKGWRLFFKNGSNAYADLVIAADGANSKVRPYLSDVEPVYSGITLIEGNIYNAEKYTPKLFSFARGGKVMAFDDGQFVGYGTKADGSIMFVVNFKTPENWLEQSGINFNNREEVFEWFKKDFASWSDEWHEFFTNDAVCFIPRPQYYFPLNQSWETDESLTLIGDAAHRMPPYAGEGANVALQDSFELAECLTGNQFTDIKEAIAHFEKEMVERGAKATKDTLENSERMFSKTGLAQMTEFFNHVKKQ
ncbi:FAD-dependent monooxygenase [Mucilaginibacter rubeus]|uniref:Flavin-dependent monooxygenase n=1 Tax=Mucilaginibacter rubeus TaxID=2027860 RepID=A0AAE6JIP7_9SPHI|nr:MULTISPECIES: NAD(P)/FAD-dependent oxidoreductase [Mucilaginibacter]QEM06519.1 FAD-dependent monooxygenase [Mucilaginibacter rubeus]QEM19108.1 FAD-dependent monooxygenase [Mucilaginibacter gossypii]QTE44351.1 FAD-dependent monooxygenase [Mucilaginibacter rubeus]QTE50951.1 FAD-dependent monooxygenase [Mucilaginibacter rubeus]QTE56034.1 FAD-dependent monooxygenase [Mucilaginibacter rubeus]